MTPAESSPAAFPPADSVDATKDASRRITADGRHDATDRGIESVGLQFMIALEGSGIPKEELVKLTLSEILTKFADLENVLDQENEDDEDVRFDATESRKVAAASANVGAGDDAASRTDQGWPDYEAVRDDGDRRLFSRGNFGKYGRPSSARSSKTLTEDVPVSSTASGFSVRSFARSKNVICSLQE